MAKAGDSQPAWAEDALGWIACKAGVLGPNACPATRSFSFSAPHLPPLYVKDRDKRAKLGIRGSQVQVLDLPFTSPATLGLLLHTFIHFVQGSVLLVFGLQSAHLQMGIIMPTSEDGFGD